MYNTTGNYHIYSYKVPNMNEDKLLKFLNEVNMSACQFVSVYPLLVTDIYLCVSLSV